MVEFVLDDAGGKGSEFDHYGFHLGGVQVHPRGVLVLELYPLVAVDGAVDAGDGQAAF